MPTSSPRTAYQTGWPTDPLRGRIARTRVVLAIERVLPRLWPAFGFIGLYFALALAGVFAFVPWPLQALALLNNPFMVRQAEHLAARVKLLAPQADQQVTWVYRLALNYFTLYGDGAGADGHPDAMA